MSNERPHASGGDAIYVPRRVVVRSKAYERPLLSKEVQSNPAVSLFYSVLPYKFCYVESKSRHRGAVFPSRWTKKKTRENEMKMK